MKWTVQRYVLREVVQTWLAVTGVLVAILVSNQLSRVLGQAAENQYGRGVVFDLIALGAIRKDAAACLIEPDSVTSRKYLMAVDSIIRTFPRPTQLPKDTAGAGYRSNFEAGWV